MVEGIRMPEEELFRIVIDEEVGKIEAFALKDAGDKIWRWIKSGSDRILNITTEGLASAADKVRERIQTKLGGKWEVSQISLKVSSNPSATIIIKRKS